MSDISNLCGSSFSTSSLANTTKMSKLLIFSLVLLRVFICSAQDDMDSILYLDIYPANLTDSLFKIRQIPLKTFVFKYDKIVGRRQMGLIGAEGNVDGKLAGVGRQIVNIS